MFFSWLMLVYRSVYTSIDLFLDLFNPEPLFNSQQVLGVVVKDNVPYFFERFLCSIHVMYIQSYRFYGFLWFILTTYITDRNIEHGGNISEIEW